MGQAFSRTLPGLVEHGLHQNLVLQLPHSVLFNPGKALCINSEFTMIRAFLNCPEVIGVLSWNVSGGKINCAFLCFLLAFARVSTPSVQPETLHPNLLTSL